MCAPIFERAGVGFESRIDYEGQQPNVLWWFARPEAFLQKYPTSRIDESYGSQWLDVYDIDYSVTIDRRQSRLRVEVEGWDLPTIYLDTTGSGTFDGLRLASLFARILNVDWIVDEVGTSEQ